MKTPGVYILEKSAFPNSVVEVATAVPAFIGYTEMAMDNTTPLLNKPWRITSMTEFHNFFGYGPTPQFTVINQDTTKAANYDSSAPSTECLDVIASPEDSYHIYLPKAFYTLYYNILLFYANGGGPCYIVSVGNYQTSPSSQHIIDGIEPLIKEQEPTMVVIPEAVNFPSEECIKIQQAMLMHCGDKMKNRFAILDIWKGVDLEHQGKAVKDFRENIGSNYLSYCASYFPWIETSILTEQNLEYKNLKWALYEESQKETVKWPDSIKGIIKEHYIKQWNRVYEEAKQLLIGEIINKLTTDLNTEITKNTFTEAVNKLFPKDTDDNPKKPEMLTPAEKDKIIKDSLKIKEVQAILTTYQDEVNKIKPSGKKESILSSFPISFQKELSKLLTPDTLNDPLLSEVKKLLESIYTNQVTMAVAPLLNEKIDEIKLPTLQETLDFIDRSSAELHSILAQNWSVYKNILATVKNRLNLLPPSAAMAGIYTMIDNSRGVWKAPANVSINNVVKPSCNITQDDQEDLNVPLSGKAVNAIRFFTGEGIKIWGARTMDGNSLDWRYINVRRTMIFLEESIKNAARAYVFEPNVAGTWINMKGMIENFLRGIWKRGGLAGATPEDAFSVHVGLGDTMTPDDILEGILRITVLIAISHPAEFIEITFQQQMQKS